jgi:hypothetical protein
VGGGGAELAVNGRAIRFAGLFLFIAVTETKTPFHVTGCQYPAAKSDPVTLHFQWRSP